MPEYWALPALCGYLGQASRAKKLVTPRQVFKYLCFPKFCLFVCCCCASHARTCWSASQPRRFLILRSPFTLASFGGEWEPDQEALILCTLMMMMMMTIFKCCCDFLEVRCRFFFFNFSHVFKDLSELECTITDREREFRWRSWTAVVVVIFVHNWYEFSRFYVGTCSS
jgi:hypothetical protein